MRIPIDYKNLNADCTAAVESLCDTMMSNFLCRFSRQELGGLAGWQNEISKNDVGDGCLVELEMYDRVRLVVCWGYDYVATHISCCTNSLEIEINYMAVNIVRQMAEKMAGDILNKLKKFMNEHGLKTKHIVKSNSHRQVKHFAKSDIGDNRGSIYRYRNLEEERTRVDVYEYRLMNSRFCCFEKHIKPEGVTEEENCFRAT